ncbi:MULTISPECIES: flagellar hook-basal body protein [Asticcacaulis]|uniref:flagellar hook-basal body protein n=1 Tax=Asticcacaulis TaxID=76890 RepID=UPI001AE1E24C|nr:MULTISPECIES: flagellar hook-basal body protein [Asticcacaulis]MBP2161184.1 flagellar basal-body rod protein FlgG [Asticcacaulis solisilvae]MDR6802229.1 flagellar basal-body rod protein FlgG [Asticcacaulis sp. BE141]
MNGVFHIGATGLDSQQRALEIVANNIANMNTPAFKQSRAQFSQLMAGQGVQDAGSGTSLDRGQPVFQGVRLTGSTVDFAQGTLSQTGSQLDLAIDGSGFIELMGPAGQTLLWRGGTLKVNNDGFLAASNGMPLQAMISVPRDARGLAIGMDGRVTATVEGGVEPLEIGRIELVQDMDPASLKAITGGAFQPAEDAELIRSAPGVEGAGVLAQGYVETSNVDLAKEMVSLMLMQRTYSANAQIVQAGDQLMSIANDLKR